MDVIREPVDMQRWSGRMRRAGESIGLVPTMGYLHAGHVALVRRCGELAGKTVVSIYVNPTQFGPGEDLDTYPRDLDRDLDTCRSEGVDAVFYPTDAGMYVSDHSVFVTEDCLANRLCGASRPGHFRGVLTIVCKLFNLVGPSVAVFGRKDYQQAVLIRRMVRDLDFGVRIVAAPTVRESDGLAMSSRNRYLSDGERKQALALRRALAAAERMHADGVQDGADLKAGMMACFEAARGVTLEYLEIVDAETLDPVDRVGRPAAVLLAARVGNTRLIDNTVLPPGAGIEG